MLQLVEPPKIPSLYGCPKIQGQLEASNSSRGRKGTFRYGLASPESEEGAMNLVTTKNSWVVGGKIFMRAEGIPTDEENEVVLAGSKWRLTPRSRFKWDLDLAC
ncbi:hypothetical protein A2U01_0043609, partial [Trifolium medium]|nr:hypothetical protein [Trifolium medium]